MSSLVPTQPTAVGEPAGVPFPGKPAWLGQAHVPELMATGGGGGEEGES